jgi:uncharacterized protein with FMN-binding domain
VRKVTKNIVGVLSLGVLATSWSLGQAAETGLSLGGAATNTNTAQPTPEATQSASSTASASPEASASAPASTTPTPAPTPAPTKTATTSAASVTKTSAAVSYIAKDRQGVMQLSVTKTGSKITNVTIISGGTEGGEWASVPSILAQAAIDAQGSNFGNISRATHTTDAFKQALESALAKF